MTPQERVTAKKTARIIRAARKQLALTQQTVSARLGISQSALSKLEHGTLIPSAPQWFEFCQMTGIPTDSLLTGYIERNRPALLHSSPREGSFKLPKRYSRDRGSKVRALLPFLHFMYASFGEKKGREFLKSMKVDPDFFVDLDNQISLAVSLDLSRELIRQKFLKPKDLSALTRVVSQPETHGSLHLRYDGTQDTANLLNLLIINSRHYECNFNYRIEDQKRQHLDLSVEPEKHLGDLAYKNDPDLGDFICRYKQSYFERFTQYGKANSEKVDPIRELDCHYKGAPKCIYRIQIAA